MSLPRQSIQVPAIGDKVRINSPGHFHHGREGRIEAYTETLIGDLCLVSVAGERTCYHCVERLGVISRAKV
jgi:hypothetical protein